MASPSTPKEAVDPNNQESGEDDEYCSEESDESSEDEVCSKESDDMRCRKALIDFIIHDELRLETVESPSFKELMFLLNPDYVLPSKSDVEADISKLFEKEKQKLEKVLKLQRISVGTSIWMSDPNLGYDSYYMCVNAHWIDESWSLQKRTIGFFTIPDSEADSVAEALMYCLNDWGIAQVHAVTMDNELSSHMTTDILNEKLKQNGVSVLKGGVLQLRCVCDVINSIVEDGLKEFAPWIAKIESALMYATSSIEANLKFKECAEAERIESKPTLCFNNETKWNTTCTMLEAALRYRKAFDRLKDNDGSEFEGLVDSDWENAMNVVRYLKPLYDLVMSLSIASSPKSNICFPYLHNVKKDLSGLSGDGNTLMRQMVENTDAKFVEHWGDPEKINCVFFLAMVLDPRYKMTHLEHCLESIYKAEAVQKLLEDVKACLYKLSDEYTCDPTNSTRSRKEVDLYLSEYHENISTNDFNVLAWWRDNGNKYMVLSRIAKDALAVPMSSLSPNSVFSVGGRFVDRYRSQLSPLIVNVLVCVKDWLASYMNPDPRDIISDDLDPVIDEEPDDDDDDQ